MLWIKQLLLMAVFLSFICHFLAGPYAAIVSHTYLLDMLEWDSKWKNTSISIYQK